jgi:hypothetical protein
MNRNATLNILRQHAHFLIGEIKEEKKIKGEAWEKAVPETDTGEMWFRTYCHSKKLLSSLRRELKTTNDLIKFIKKNIK